MPTENILKSLKSEKIDVRILATPIEVMNSMEEFYFLKSSTSFKLQPSRDEKK